jgi:hypothetical protein
MVYYRGPVILSSFQLRLLEAKFFGEGKRGSVLGEGTRDQFARLVNAGYDRNDLKYRQNDRPLEYCTPMPKNSFPRSNFVCFF